MGGVGALYIGARAVTMRHSASQPRDGHNIAKDFHNSFSTHSPPSSPICTPVLCRPVGTSTHAEVTPEGE